MISIDDGVNNIVIFKEGTTNDQINDFWNRTISLERSDGKGYDHLPGLGTIAVFRIKRLDNRNA